MNEEYQMVRDVMKKQLRLSPYNEKEPLCLVVDGASSVGAGYVLFQWRDSQDPGAGAHIISANSTMFPKNRVFSPIDGELMALVFACRATGYWTSHCPDLHLFSDCRGLLQMMGRISLILKILNIERCCVKYRLSSSKQSGMFQGRAIN